VIGNAITYISTGCFVKVEVVNASLFIYLSMYLSTQCKFIYKTKNVFCSFDLVKELIGLVQTSSLVMW
jgi:hypothetical protein